MTSNHNTYDRGLQGESVALAFLRLKGYHILKIRYRTPYGEIDILAQQKNTIVCVEVKTRSTLNESLEAITPLQKERIMNAYLHFIQLNPEYTKFGIRFDVIVCAPNAKPIHLENAFEENYD